MLPSSDNRPRRIFNVGEDQIKSGDNIPARIEPGYRVLPSFGLLDVCKRLRGRPAAVGEPDVRYLDQPNKDRRFILLRLDDAPVKGLLARFLCIDRLADDRQGSTLPGCSRTREIRAPRPFAWAYEAARKWSISPDEPRALSGSLDNTVRLWDIDSGRCMCVLEGNKFAVLSVALRGDGRRVYSAAGNCVLRMWDLAKLVTEKPTQKAATKAARPAPDQVQYTNAKVLLVGETRAGKTGLSVRLALDKWQQAANSL